MEGTAAELGCNASGNPLPHVACAKLGDPHAPPASPNVTRAHAGTYQCRATNAHGSALRNITITVECERGTGSGGGGKKENGERFGVKKRGDSGFFCFPTQTARWR